MAKIVKKAVKKSVKKSLKYKRTSEKVKLMGKSRTVYLRVKDGVKVVRVKGVYRKLSKMLKMDGGAKKKMGMKKVVKKSAKKVVKKSAKKSMKKSKKGGGPKEDLEKRIVSLAMTGGDCGCANTTPMSGGDAYGRVLAEEHHGKMYGGEEKDAFPRMDMSMGGKRRRRRSSSKKSRKSKSKPKKILGLFGGALDAMGFPKLKMEGGDAEEFEMEGGKKVKKAKKSLKAKKVKKAKKVMGGEYAMPKLEGGAKKLKKKTAKKTVKKVVKKSAKKSMMGGEYEMPN